MTILNACFLGPTELNLAEYFIQPIDYFAFPSVTKKVWLDSRVTDYIDSSISSIIIGGSGIYGPSTWQILRNIAEVAPPKLPIIIWGMGINDHNRLDRQYDATLEYLEVQPNVLIGLRDWFYNTHVPCVSCMRPEFDAHFDTEYEIGLYLHMHFTLPGLSDAQKRYPMMSNCVSGNPLTYLWRVLQFLGSCHTVVTNSYHGAYWATLLKRRVVVVSPFSNKFFGLKYEPIIVPSFKHAIQYANLAKSYPEALPDCRRANTQFHQRVLAFQQSLT